MKFKKGKSIITTYDVKMQRQLMEQGLKPLDTDIQPKQDDVIIVDSYTIKKKPARKG